MNGTKTTSADVIFTELEDGAMLLDVKTKRYYELNETAAAVWRGLEAGESLDRIAAGLSEAYDVTPERARESVERVVSDFERRALLAPQGG